MRIGLAAYTAAVRNGGSATRQLIERRYLDGIFVSVEPARALDVVDRHFALTADTAGVWARERKVRDRDKCSPNPLQAALIVVYDHEFVAPAAHYLLDRIRQQGFTSSRPLPGERSS